MDQLASDQLSETTVAVDGAVASLNASVTFVDTDEKSWKTWSVKYPPHSVVEINLYEAKDNYMCSVTPVYADGDSEIHLPAKTVPASSITVEDLSEMISHALRQSDGFRLIVNSLADSVVSNPAFDYTEVTPMTFSNGAGSMVFGVTMEKDGVVITSTITFGVDSEEFTLESEGRGALSDGKYAGIRWNSGTRTFYSAVRAVAFIEEVVRGIIETRSALPPRPGPDGIEPGPVYLELSRSPGSYGKNVIAVRFGQRNRRLV